MTTMNPSQVLSNKKAAADLSSNRYRVIKLSTAADTLEAVAASTDIPFAVQLNKPVTNEAVEYAPIGSGGEVCIELGAVLGIDDIVSIDASGKAAADTTGNYRIGQLTKGGNTGDVGRVMLNTMVPKA